MVRISEQTGFGYLRLSKGELENEKDLLASPEGGRQEGFPENCCISLQQFECLK